MAEVEELQQQLLTAQNADGGWAFQPGRSSSGRSSWTEPTALSLLALNLPNVDNPPKDVPRARAIAWLAKHQNIDGGWPPTGTVPTSTWVTSLCVLALPKTAEHQPRLRNATEWLMRAINPQLSPLRQLFLRAGIPSAKDPGGSPWYPGTAGWIIPTSITLLALSQMNAPASYLTESQSFLLSHRCPDGGWNHGGSLFRSENSPSYPETTGLALLALAHFSTSDLQPAVRLSQSFLQHPESLEALSWLQMGLLAHSIQPQTPSRLPPPHGIRDIALRLLAVAAMNGPNPLLLTT